MSLIEDHTRIRDLRNELRRLEADVERQVERRGPITEADERAMLASQSRFDEAYSEVGRRAPPPMAYERPGSYARRLVQGLQGYSERWRGANIAALPTEAFQIAQEQIRDDARKGGPRAGLRPGEIKAIDKSNGAGRVTEFVGGEDAWFGDAFRRQPKRALFASPSEYAATARANLLSKVTERVWNRPTVQAPRAAF